MDKNRSIAHTDSWTVAFRNQQGNWKHPVKPSPVKWRPVLKWQIAYWQGNLFKPEHIYTELALISIIGSVFCATCISLAVLSESLTMSWMNTAFVRALISVTGSTDITQWVELCEGLRILTPPWVRGGCSHDSRSCYLPSGVFTYHGYFVPATLELFWLT